MSAPRPTVPARLPDLGAGAPTQSAPVPSVSVRSRERNYDQPPVHFLVRTQSLTGVLEESSAPAVGFFEVRECLSAVPMNSMR